VFYRMTASKNPGRSWDLGRKKGQIVQKEFVPLREKSIKSIRDVTIESFISYIYIYIYIYIHVCMCLYLCCPRLSEDSK
jgi:hypothetical protein